MAGGIRAESNHRLSLIGPELPRVFADVFGRSTEDCALNRDAAVNPVVVARREQSFDRNPKQNDSSLFSVDAPPRDAVVIGAERKSADFEAHLLQLRPGAPKEVHGIPDRHVEPIDPALKWRQWRADHLASAQPPVTSMPSTAARSCGTRI